MAERAIAEIKLEISQIDDLLKSYSVILDKIEEHHPDLIEITALASVLHSFYNGLENIFLTIAKRIDRKVPAGDRWHRDLLNVMGKSGPRRDQVLSKELIQIMSEYMAFRHYYRHSYSFSLEWDELEKLAVPVKNVWNRFKEEIEIFINSMQNNFKNKS